MPYHSPRRSVHHARILAAAVLAAWLAAAPGAPAFAQKITDAGFKVQLLYQVPDIEHPSVVTCDDAGNLFVGEDPMDMRGPSTKEFDRILYITFNPDGSVKRKTVFAEGLSAVFGLIWHEGALYVMHAPHYTMFKDTDGDGVADVRKRLADGFGPPPGVFGFNDHIVSGTRLGMDGFVYVSVGDKGIQKATGSDGSTLVHEGGGVVRMKLDGSQLESFTTGTRNHLDVAMDSLDNIFTYDNTDDGLGWWTRFTHHVPTGYYGYPFDYHPHPERHLPRISEHGGGSPVGAACYRGAAWPGKYRDAAFHCEWGKGKIQVFFLKRKGASFDATMQDFMVRDGAEEFRPLDLCFSPDGRHMYVADWNYGGWMNPKHAGRLFRVTFTGAPGSSVDAEPPRATDADPIAAQVKSLGHPAHFERVRAQWALARLGAKAVEPVRQALRDGTAPKFARIHAIWTLNALVDRVKDLDVAPDWIAALKSDKDGDVRAQAARALGEQRMKAALRPLIDALKDHDPSVRMHAAVALGRIGDPMAAVPLFTALNETDIFARFTMIQALRAINDWQAAPSFLRSNDQAIRQATVLAMTGVYDDLAAAVLADYLKHGTDPQVQARAVEALAEIHHKADPYTKGWWGTRPAAGKPPRAKKNDWSGTPIVLAALTDALSHPAAPVRVAAIRAQMEVADAAALPVLRAMLQNDRDDTVRQQVISVLAEQKDKAALPILAKMLADASTSADVRQDAVTAIVAIGSPAAAEALVAVIRDPASKAALLTTALDALTAIKSPGSAAPIAPLLEHADPAVRAKAVEAYGAIAGADAAVKVRARLGDDAPAVRASAAKVLGDLQVRDAVPEIIAAAQQPEVRQAAMLALAAMPDRRALTVYLAGLTDKNPQVRQASGSAVALLRDAVANDIVGLNKRNELSPQVRRALGGLFAKPAPVLTWQVLGAWSKDGPQPKFDTAAAPALNAAVAISGRQLRWQTIKSTDPNGMVNAAAHFQPNSNCWVMAYTTVQSDTAGTLNWMLGSDDQATLWINGEQVYQFNGDRGWAANQAKGDATIKPGVNHVWLQSGNSGGPWQFSLALGGPDPKFAFLYKNVPPELDIEAYRQHALKTTGDAKRGEQAFFDPHAFGCSKCHSVGKSGTAMVGPNLLGVGAKYPREELIRSVLEPSSRILSGYDMVVVITEDGQTLQGVIKSDTDKALQMLNADGQTVTIAADKIVDKRRSNLSMMPNGLEKGMTLKDFADIIAFLESQKGP